MKKSLTKPWYSLGLPRPPEPPGPPRPLRASMAVPGLPKPPRPISRPLKSHNLPILLVFANLLDPLNLLDLMNQLQQVWGQIIKT